MRFLLVCTTVLTMLTAFAVSAGGDPEALARGDIIQLLRGNTTECRKEKDQSMCSNYFTAKGVIKRIMHDDGKRRDGRWFIDDQSRLCILWDGKLKPLCFKVYAQPDGSYNLIKKGRHITTITGVEDGNSRDL